jgi:alcohol dehydrogenase (cytochrome c)
MLGGITAMDPATGQQAGKHTFDYPSYSGVLATAGGLVFTTTLDGTVWALDDKTLEPLWHFNTGTLSTAPPMTYSAGGKQYVAVLLGANAIARGPLGKTPEAAEIRNTSMLYVFGL